MYATSTRRFVFVVTQTGWLRPFALAAAILFFLAGVFPLGAGLAKDTSAFPKWWGAVDVGLAFVLAIVANEPTAKAISATLVFIMSSN